MVEQGDQMSTRKKIAFTIGSLILAAAYFTFLDWFAMNIQGLDYFYMFRK
jgi:flagellar biogenesis protein FliO